MYLHRDIRCKQCVCVCVCLSVCLLVCLCLPQRPQNLLTPVSWHDIKPYWQQYSKLHYAGAHADRWHTLVAAKWQVSMAVHLLGLLLEGLLSDVLARRRYLLELTFLLSRGRRHIHLHPPKGLRKYLVSPHKH